MIIDISLLHGFDLINICVWILYLFNQFIRLKKKYYIYENIFFYNNFSIEN